MRIRLAAPQNGEPNRAALDHSTTARLHKAYDTCMKESHSRACLPGVGRPVPGHVGARSAEVARGRPCACTAAQPVHSSAHPVQISGTLCTSAHTYIPGTELATPRAHSRTRSGAAVGAPYPNTKDLILGCGHEYAAPAAGPLFRAQTEAAREAYRIDRGPRTGLVVGVYPPGSRGGRMLHDGTRVGRRYGRGPT